MKFLTVIFTCSLLILFTCTLNAQQNLDVEGLVIVKSGVPSVTFFDNAVSENRSEGRIGENGDNIYVESYVGDVVLSAKNFFADDLRVQQGSGRIGINGLPGSAARLTIHEDLEAIRLDGTFSAMNWYDGATIKAEIFVDNSNRMALGTRQNASLRLKTNNATRMTFADNGSIQTGKAGSLSGRNGALLLCDSDPLAQGTTASGADDQFVARFRNGYFFMTSGNSPRTGIVAGPGANAWSSISDINRKENFEYLNDVENFEKLSSVNYSSWNYIGQNPKAFRHYGIMAQDFYRLFGQDSFGTIGSDKLVNPIDMIGVTMSALKGASIKIDQQADVIASQSNDIKKLMQYIIDLKDELDSIKLMLGMN